MQTYIEGLPSTRTARMPPKTKGKGRKTGAQKKKKNPSPGESQWVKDSAPALLCPPRAARWSGFVLVLSFVLLTQAHYGTRETLKPIPLPQSA